MLIRIELPDHLSDAAAITLFECLEQLSQQLWSRYEEPLVRWCMHSLNPPPEPPERPELEDLDDLDDPIPF